MQIPLAIVHIANLQYLCGAIKRNQCSFFNEIIMKTTSFLPFSQDILWTTIICTIIIVVAIVYLSQRAIVTSDTLTRVIYWISAGILAVALLSAVCMCPRKVKVNEHAIDVYMLIGKVHIPAEEVVAIKHYPQGIDSHRIVGMGMFFGNLGVFDSSDCGRHFSLVTNPSNVCVIVRKTKQPVVVSVKDCSVFTAIGEVEEKD